jgi:hypothetical protein
MRAARLPLLVTLSVAVVLVALALFQQVRAQTPTVDYLTLTVALAAVVAAGASVTAIFVQVRLSVFTTGLEIEERYEERFSRGSAMVEARKKAAEVLLDSDSSAHDLEEVDDVLDFLETVALLLNRRVLDEELVWSSFFLWFRGYRWAADRRIVEMRTSTGDPTYWDNFTKGYEQLATFDAKRRHIKKAELKPTTDELVEFLQWELSAAVA